MTLRAKFTEADKVQLFELRQAGFSTAAISEKMNRTEGDVIYRMAEMVKMYNLPRRKINSRKVVITDGKLRKCLRCQKEFLSEWAGHRRCHKCQGGSPLQEAWQVAAGI